MNTFRKRGTEAYISVSSVRFPMAAGTGPCSSFEEKFLFKRQYISGWLPSDQRCINGGRNPGGHCHDFTGTYSLSTTWLPCFNWQENPSHADGEQGSAPFHDLSISCPGFLSHSSSFSCLATSPAERSAGKSPVTSGTQASDLKMNRKCKPASHANHMQ